MNHQKVYESIISNAKSQNRKKLKKSDVNYVYYENHHILPKCMGGGEEIENRVLLTAREHFICHKLLTYMYKGNIKIINAFWRMTFDKQGNRNISSKDYAYARELKSNTPMAKETRDKLSKIRKGKRTGKPAWNRGIPITNPITIEKIRKANKGKKMSNNVKKKISVSLLGKNIGKIIVKDKNNLNYSVKKDDPRYLSKELTSIHLGKIVKKTTKEKMSNSHKGK
jgi:hypothetical protein